IDEAFVLDPAQPTRRDNRLGFGLMGRTIAMPARTVNVFASIPAGASLPCPRSCTDRPGRNSPMRVASPLLHHMVMKSASGEAALLRRSWTVTACGRMHARVGGAPGVGRPVVLVHGLVISGRYMAPTAVALSPLGAAPAGRDGARGRVGIRPRAPG